MSNVLKLRQYISEGKVADADLSFAKSITRKDNPSPKQMKWVHILIERVENPPAPVKKTKVGSMAPMVAVIKLFQAGRSKLKYPKVRVLSLQARAGLEKDDLFDYEAPGHTMRLSIAGPKSKFPGTINVVDENHWGRYGREWFGRIDSEGVFTPSRKYEGATEVIETLKAFAKSPKQAAEAYGHLTGHCCFCNAALDDKRSVEVGYGPVCAKNYGLPWGGKKK